MLQLQEMARTGEREKMKHRIRSNAARAGPLSEKDRAMFSPKERSAAAAKLSSGKNCPVNCGLPQDVKEQLKSGALRSAGPEAMTVISHGGLMNALQKNKDTLYSGDEVEQVRCQASQPAPSALPASLCPAPSALPACRPPSALPCPSPPVRLVAVRRSSPANTRRCLRTPCSVNSAGRCVEGTFFEPFPYHL